jgi:endoglucanase
LIKDGGGNLLINQKGRKRHAPVVAVAHIDHPAFVVSSVDDAEVEFEFRGGVNPEYFTSARVRFVPSGRVGRVEAYDAATQTGRVRLTGSGEVETGDIGIWVFQRAKAKKDRFLAPACDDLAGAAAALAALDRARSNPELSHFSVLLTRAEEVGLIGAIHAAKEGTVGRDSRILSIETSRASDYAPIGAGPVIRVGDRSTVFDQRLTNVISRSVQKSGINHQRKLMDGGGCEATAFGVYGYQATGLCLPLGNWHNRGNLDEFEAGTGDPIPMLEEISLADFHGLIGLLLVAARAVDEPDDLRDRFDEHFEESRHVLN